MPDDPIWLRPERAGRGPAPEHSRERIAAAATALADAAGLAAVSMRKVAASLGAGTASLYRYVDTRDELVALMVDAVNGELGYPRPTTGDWRADLLAIGHDLRELYRRHPWLLEIQPSAVGLGPNGVAYLEQSLAALSVLDRPTSAKLEVAAMLSGVVSLFARDEAATRPASSPDGRAATARYLAAVVTPDRYPHLAAAFAPTVPSATVPTPAVPTDGGDELFDRVVGGLVAGLLGV